MADKPILDYAGRDSTPPLLWASAKVLPEFVFGVFAGGVSLLFYLQYANSDSRANEIILLARVAANTLLIMAIACTTAWITRVLAETRHPRRHLTFRTKAAIGFVYFWAVHIANMAWISLFFRYRPSDDLRLLIVFPFVGMVLLAVVAGLILSPRSD